MKKIILSVGMLLALNVNAEMNYLTCDFAEEKGVKFRFLQIEPETRFENRESGSVYPYWVDSRFKPVNLSENDYSFRQAKLSTEYFYARKEGNQVGKEPSLVRYYRAVTESCDVVWARIDETDQYFSKFFDPENHMLDGDINWKYAEDVLGIQLNDEMLKLKASIGHEYTVIPMNDGSQFKGKLTSQERDVVLENYEKLKLVDIYPSMYVFHGEKKGSSTIKAKRSNGDIVLIPWDPERLSYQDPLVNKKIRAKHIESIKNGNINFGMNTAEVEASWGKPERIRYLPLYNNEQGLDRFIKTDFYAYGQEFIEYKVERHDNRKPIGFYEEWFYDKKLPTKQTLVFDDADLLNENEQTRMIQKNTLYNPVPLPEIE